MKYWNEKRETISEDEKMHLQSLHLIDCVNRVYNNVDFYRKKMDNIGVTTQDIKSVEDLYKLPFTTKQDLRDNYPYGTFAVPMKDVVRIHASSGTTGKQTVVGYTKQDLATWGEVMARSLVAAGGDSNSIVHVSYGYGLFTGGLGAHAGAEFMGATVIPVSTGNTKRQIQIMQDYGSTILCCTPSYALYIADTIEEMKIPLESIHIKAGVFGAEPWTENMRKLIEKKLNLKAHDVYGLSEIIGPGVSIECEHQCGLHVQDDHFIPEIVNPDTGKVLPYGEQGEICFSTVTKQALPLLRYRTHDVSSLDNTVCKCGRTTVRMDKPQGRTDDMLIIRGVNVFPSQIESVLLEASDIEPHYILIVDRVNGLDTLEVQIEMSDALFSDEIKKIEQLEHYLRGKIESTLGIGAKVKLVERKSIERSEGKAKRIIDKRKYE